MPSSWCSDGWTQRMIKVGIYFLHECTWHVETITCQYINLDGFYHTHTHEMNNWLLYQVLKSNSKPCSSQIKQFNTHTYTHNKHPQFIVSLVHSVVLCWSAFLCTGFSFPNALSLEVVGLPGASRNNVYRSCASPHVHLFHGSEYVSGTLLCPQRTQLNKQWGREGR